MAGSAEEKKHANRDVHDNGPSAQDRLENAAAHTGESFEAQEATEPDPRVVELQDRLLRALADAENARKRAEKAKAEGRAAGITQLAAALLPALDSLELAITSVESRVEGESKATTALLAGLEATQREFLDALERVGLRQVDPMGEPFDPAIHEAVAVRGEPGVGGGRILQVMQKGYVMGDRLVRPARVVVSSDEAKGTGQAQDK